MQHQHHVAPRGQFVAEGQPRLDDDAVLVGLDIRDACDRPVGQAVVRNGNVRLDE